MIVKLTPFKLMYYTILLDQINEWTVIVLNNDELQQHNVFMIAKLTPFKLMYYTILLDQINEWTVIVLNNDELQQHIVFQDCKTNNTQVNALYNTF